MWIITLLSLLGVFANAQKLKIVHPKPIKELFPNGFDFNIADFGYIPYGKSIHGQVYLTNPPDACQPVTLVTKESPQSVGSTPFKAKNGNKILFVDRGNCSFVTQAHFAEQAGASMMIIGDTFNENINNILLLSDHSHHVQIPTIMLENIDAAGLREIIKNTEGVMVKVHFEIQKADVPQINYFLSSLDKDSYPFIQQFRPFYKELQDNIKFNPRYVEYWCYECQQQNWTTTNDLCLSGGRYCSPDPDGTGPLIGRDVIFEDLRQLCIFQNEPSKWWTYGKHFFHNCVQQVQGREIENLTNCSYETMIQSQILTDTIFDCVNKSFDGDDPLFNDSKILSFERDEFNKIIFPYWPSLLINNVFFKGDLYFENQTKVNRTFQNISNYAVLEAVCASFNSSNEQPKICDNTKLISVNEDSVTQSGNSHYSSKTIWIMVSIILVLVMLVVFFLYRRMLKKEVNKQMSDQVNAALSQYYRFDDKAKKDDSVEA